MSRMTLLAVVALLLTALPLKAADNGLATVRSKNDAAATLEKLDAAIKAKGMKVFTHIDHAAAAKDAGLSMPPATVVVFGNPKGGTPNFLKQPTLAIDLPLKMLVWADGNGQVFVTHNTGPYVFGTLFGRHGLNPPAKVQENMESMLSGLANAAAN